jgi:hypothetical protein
MPRVKSNLACVVLVIGLQAQGARAQGELLGADEMAEAIVSMTSPVWTGPRTAPPDRMERPAKASRVLHSTYALLAVHADPEVHPLVVQRASSALEYARARLDAMGWPSPISDGNLGGGPELDLYLSGDLPSGAYFDGLARWSYLDRGSTFAVLSPETPPESVEACVTAIYAETLLLSMDPAEARTWRRATAAWLTWELLGRFGCDEAVSAQQAEPFRSWIGGAAGDGAGGALWLAYLSARHDSVRGRFVRDVWELASQRTWEGYGLRAEPDLWSAIQTAVNLSGDQLLDNVEALAVLRWFVGRSELGDSVLAAIDDDARVPIARELKRLPTRVVAPRPLQSFGSAYMVMNAAVWRGATRLRAWLRGEYGVHWSFVTVQLDTDGNEVRRIAAPHTGSTPEAYVPIELDETTERLLFVVTNLADGLPDADEAEVHQRSFELILDRADE